MKQTVKKVWNTITTALVVLIVLIALLLAGGKLLGMDTYVVLSGSMEPAYHTGSVVYVDEADTSELTAGDVITFTLSGDTIATHRIVEVVTDETGGRAFRTKGDANDVEDASLVPAENVIGTPVFTIPYLGYLVSYIQKPPGIYVAIVVAAVLILMLLLPELIFDEEEEQETAPVKAERKKPEKPPKDKPKKAPAEPPVCKELEQTVTPEPVKKSRIKEKEPQSTGKRVKAAGKREKTAPRGKRERV